MRRVLFLLAALVALLVPAPAGAQAQDIGWVLGGYSAVHLTIDYADGVHIVADRCQTSCADTLVVANWWLPVFCTWAGMSSGDGAGEPLTIRLQSADPFRSCVPSGMAWSDGWNTEGYAYGHAWYTDVREQWVFPRDSSWPWSRGTIVRIW